MSPWKISRKRLPNLFCKQYVLVEPLRFQNYLANPKQLADDGEFFYCDPGRGRKRRRGLYEEIEDW